MFTDAELTDDAFLGGALRILQPRDGYRAGDRSGPAGRRLPGATGRQRAGTGLRGGGGQSSAWGGG